MTAHKTNFSVPIPKQPRYGVTLIEVLVSMIIMSIGISLLASLLPLSILRTAQATQATQSVCLRNNAEALVESNVGMLDTANSGIAADTVGVIDPLGRFLVASTFGGTLSYTRSCYPISTTAPVNQATVMAESFSTLPDSWTTVYEGPVTTNFTTMPNVVTFQGETISNLSVRNGQFPYAAAHRMVLSDEFGRRTAILPLYQVSGQNLSWWNVNSGGTPLAYGASIPFTPSYLRVEVRERRFSWLMTVRKRSLPQSDGGWAADLDVVIFFNRSFSSAEEVPHSVTRVANGWDGQPGIRGVDDNLDGSVDDIPTPSVSEVNWIGTDDNRTLTVNTTNNPFLKKGGYMLETSELRWYRIVNFDDNTSKILLDRDLPKSLGTSFSAIFMKNIVEVYSLGSRTGVN